MKVAVCAFGTRGDVQPLAILAAEISKQLWCDHLAFVTHRDHCCADGFVEKILPGTANTKYSVLPAESPPVIWRGVDRPPEGGADSAIEHAQEAQQHACMVACEGVGLVVFNMFALEGFHIAEKLQVPCVVCQPYLIATPMPSSFAGRMRRSYPRLFRRLIRPLVKRSDSPPVQLSSPKLVLPHASTPSGATAIADSFVKSGEPEEGCTARCSKRDETAWNHVEHWMWPLFTDEWSAFRARLGLHPRPLANDEHMHSPARDDKRDDSGMKYMTPNGIDSARLPPVLYLFSGLVVDESPFWPAIVRVCGYLYTPQSAPHSNPGPRTVESKAATGEISPGQRKAGNAAKPSAVEHSSQNSRKTYSKDEAHGCLPRHVECFLLAREDRPLFIGFGSMWEMCAPGYGLACCLQSVLLAARQAGLRCLVSVPRMEYNRGDQVQSCVERMDTSRELEIATEFLMDELQAAAGEDSLLVHRGSLEQGLLFPRCLLAIHHGGSGTTAAVLKAGIPHVICPQHLDQFFWAERVQYLNVGSVLERSMFTGREQRQDGPPVALVSKAGSAILSALTPQVRLRAACLGVKIRAEDGLGNTMKNIHHFLEANTAKATADRTNRAAASIDVNANRTGEAGTELMLREMSNGIPLWISRGAEQEGFFIYNEVFEDKTYSRMGIGIHDGDTLWDVGANVGLTSIFFELGTDTPDSLSIYAFEPVPANRKTLERNLETHCPRAKILGYALGARNEDGASMTFYPRMPGNSTLRPHEKEELQGGRMGSTKDTCAICSEKRGKEMPCEDSRGSFFHGEQKVLCDVRTVSWALSNLGVERIDLLKIDVEGAELDVLSGIDNEDWPKLRQVVVEVHPVGDRVVQVCDMLRHQGFHVCKQALRLDGTSLAEEHQQSSNSDCEDEASGRDKHGRGAAAVAEDGVVYMVYARCI